MGTHMLEEALILPSETVYREVGPVQTVVAAYFPSRLTVRKFQKFNQTESVNVSLMRRR